MTDGSLTFNGDDILYNGQLITFINSVNNNGGTEEVLVQSTFGLPADVVALITSRFGTVANFLRLRNQGQV